MSLSENEQRVCDLIASRQGDLFADLQLHVGLATGGRNVDALNVSRRVFTERAAALGARVELHAGDQRPVWLYGSPGYGALGNAADEAKEAPPVAICRREELGRDAGHAPLLIAGHLDTVHDPAGSFQRLQVDEAGKIGIGPGCVDMKGGLVIALGALEALEACGVMLPWTLMLNSDEETGSYHSHRIITNEAARVAQLGGVGIALEPAGAGGSMVIERAGSGQLFVEVQGKAAHVGRDFAKGVSAVNALAAVVLRMAELSDPDRERIVNIGPLEGGQATNVVPDRARAWGNMRFPDADGAKEILAGVHTIAADFCTKGIPVRIETSLARPAKPKTPGTMRLAHLASAVSRELGHELPFAKTAGVCDGNLMQAAGLPTLDTLGVRGGGLHTPEEWIELDSLVDRCQLLAVYMMRASTRSGQ